VVVEVEAEAEAEAEVRVVVESVHQKKPAFLPADLSGAGLSGADGSVGASLVTAAAPTVIAPLEVADESTKESAANRNLKCIIFEKYKSGSFYGKEDPTCLTCSVCPVEISKEAAKFHKSMKTGYRFRQGWLEKVSGDYSEQNSQDEAEKSIHEATKNALVIMLRLETKAGIGGDGKKPGSKATATVTGLSERYRLWKKQVDNKEEKLYDQMLVDVGFKSQIKQLSIGSFFNAIKSAVSPRKKR
jgi:hypothetical protein